MSPSLAEELACKNKADLTMTPEFVGGDVLPAAHVLTRASWGSNLFPSMLEQGSQQTH